MRQKYAVPLEPARMQTDARPFTRSTDDVNGRRRTFWVSGSRRWRHLVSRGQQETCRGKAGPVDATTYLRHCAGWMAGNADHACTYFYAHLAVLTSPVLYYCVGFAWRAACLGSVNRQKFCAHVVLCPVDTCRGK
jgi:hypothetical protein